MSMGERSREPRAGSQGSTRAGAPGVRVHPEAHEVDEVDEAPAAGTAAATGPAAPGADPAPVSLVVPDMPATTATREARGLDVARDSDVPISTQLYWQLAYQVDTGRLHPGARLPTVRELGAVLRVNPNTVRAVYRRLADAGYVVSRHGAGTRVAARPPVRRTTGALDGLVAELLRTAARAGYSADEVAAAVYAVATERRRPGSARPRPLRGVHGGRCAPSRRDASAPPSTARRRPTGP